MKQIITIAVENDRPFNEVMATLSPLGIDKETLSSVTKSLWQGLVNQLVESSNFKNGDKITVISVKTLED